MSKERPFEDIIPVPNIKVGYFEKEEYLKIIDRQEKQIESSAYQILALQSRIEILEKSQRPKGEWTIGYTAKQKKVAACNLCNCISFQGKTNFCHNCGADMRGSADND